MKNRYLLFLILSISLNGVDIKYGKGKFDVDMNIGGVMKIDKSFDINTLTISNYHNKIGSSNFYYFYDMDIYQSKTSNYLIDIMKATDLTIPSNIPVVSEIPGVSTVTNTIDDITKPIQDVVNSAKDTAIDMTQNTLETVEKVYDKTPLKKIPVVNDAKDMVTAPFNLKVKGFDVNVGAGYDIWKNRDGRIGIGVATGVSAPYIYSKNGASPMLLAFSIMNSSDTSMMSYKTLATIQGSYRVIENLRVESNILYGYQFGKMNNSLLDSDVDIYGINSTFNLGVNYSFGSFASWAKDITISAGATYKRWQTKQTSIKLLDSAFEGDLSKAMSADFDSKNYYLGIGYRF